MGRLQPVATERGWVECEPARPELFGRGVRQRLERRIVESRTRALNVSPAEAFSPIRRIGGANGWYAFDRLWRVRALVDRMLGGAGLRPGRRDPEILHVGDAVDWWRVEEYEPDRLLRLRAEMKLPGRAWLEFEVTPSESGSRIRQTVVFDPGGWAGRLYWYGIYPLHAAVFRGMLAGIVRAARKEPPRERPSRERCP